MRQAALQKAPRTTWRRTTHRLFVPNQGIAGRYRKHRGAHFPGGIEFLQSPTELLDADSGTHRMK